MVLAGYGTRGKLTGPNALPDLLHDAALDFLPESRIRMRNAPRCAARLLCWARRHRLARSLAGLVIARLTVAQNLGATERHPSPIVLS